MMLTRRARRWDTEGNGEEVGRSEKREMKTRSKGFSTEGMERRHGGQRR